MRLGIHGRPGSGRRTVFGALGLGLKAEEKGAKKRGGPQLEVVGVPDERLKPLAAIHKSKKTVPIRLTYVLPDETSGPAHLLTQLSALNGLLLVVRNFIDAAGQPPQPRADLAAIEDDFILRDLGVVENRLERVGQGRAKGEEISAEEERLLQEALALLEEGRSLRVDPGLARSPEFKSYAFLSAKPRLVVVNNAEGAVKSPDLGLKPEETLVLQGLIEGELAQLEEEEQAVFRQEYGLTQSGLARAVTASFKALELITFFTGNEEECRAWPLERGSNALAAAGAVHSDLAQGFIRAEVISASDLITAGSLAQARQLGTWRLEGKDYLVQDGDVLNIRFKV